MSLAELDRAIGAFIAGTYHLRAHGEIGETPLDAWRGDGFLPRLPDSLEELDLLLVTLAKPRGRAARRHPLPGPALRRARRWPAYVGEAVTIRYDPRDLAEIRVFHRDRFLCRAVSQEHAGEAVDLKDIQAARRAHRRALRAGINERVARVVDFLPPAPTGRDPRHRPAARARTATRLRLYQEDDR